MKKRKKTKSNAKYNNNSKNRKNKSLEKKCSRNSSSSKEQEISEINQIITEKNYSKKDNTSLSNEDKKKKLLKTTFIFLKNYLKKIKKCLLNIMNYIQKKMEIQITNQMNFQDSFSNSETEDIKKKESI